MIYFFYSENSGEANRKAEKFLLDLRKKKPDAGFLVLEQENFSVSLIQGALQSQGLFSTKTALYLKGVIDDKKNVEIIENFLKEMKVSENIFIISGSDVSAKLVKEIEKLSIKSVIGEKEQKEEKFNIFSLTNSILDRDRKGLWLKLHDALENTSAESIQGTLFWQVKAMVSSIKESNAEDAGLKPFSYSGALRGAKKYSKEELETMLFNLVEMTHEAHNGKYDLENKLEEFVLSI